MTPKELVITSNTLDMQVKFKDGIRRSTWKNRLTIGQLSDYKGTDFSEVFYGGKMANPRINLAEKAVRIKDIERNSAGDFIITIQLLSDYELYRYSPSSRSIGGWIIDDKVLKSINERLFGQK